MKKIVINLALLLMLCNCTTALLPNEDITDQILAYNTTQSEIDKGLADVLNDFQEKIAAIAARLGALAKKEIGSQLLDLIDEVYTSCMIDPAAAELEDSLREIANNLRNDRVYTLFLNNGSASPIEDVWLQCNTLVRRVFGNRIYIHRADASWPKMRDLKGKVIVFLDESSSHASKIPATQLCIHASKDWIFETPFDYETDGRDLRDYQHNHDNSTLLYPQSKSTATVAKISPDGCYCGIDRGEDTYKGALIAGAQSTNKMYLMHHYMTEGLAGKKCLAQHINGKNRVIERVTICHDQIRFWPTFIQFDYVNADAQNAVAALNQQILQAYQKNDATIKTVDDLRYNQVVHLVAHNAPNYKSPGYYASHPAPSKYKQYVDRLWLAWLIKYKVCNEKQLLTLAVNDQDNSIEKQIQQYDVVGFKVPIHADPKVGDDYDSNNHILWCCHGLEKSDLKDKIRDVFDLNG